MPATLQCRSLPSYPMYPQKPTDHQLLVLAKVSRHRHQDHHVNYALPYALLMVRSFQLLLQIGNDSPQWYDESTSTRSATCRPWNEWPFVEGIVKL
ncbi:hypothetical protein L1887_11732 [Cichorium endivia]|nr:hypothetical protein L1887_11732 [Cichorium endivia]